MAEVQTDYSESIAAGFPGMPANGETSNRITRTCEDAGGIPFGVPVYRGTGDHDSNTATPVVEMWSPGYSLYTLLAGYSTRIYDRPTNFAINIANLFDKDYYRSGGVASGSWGDPRSFRFTASTDF